MNWIDKLERRYGNLGIPYLINGLMIGQLAAGLIVLLFDWKFASMISLSRISVLQGQIWRLVTFLFQPIWLGGVLGVLNLVFYFWIGNALTRVWGDFRMTLFMALGGLLPDRLGRAERHLPEHAVCLHLALAGPDGAAVRHHPL